MPVKIIRGVNTHPTAGVAAKCERCLRVRRAPLRRLGQQQGHSRTESGCKVGVNVLQNLFPVPASTMNNNDSVGIKNGGRYFSQKANIQRNAAGTCNVTEQKIRTASK